MDKRTGFVGIIIEDLTQVEKVNAIIGKYRNLVLGRIGIPDKERSSAVIGLIIEGTNDEAGAFTGKLGNIKGVITKCALASIKEL